MVGKVAGVCKVEDNNTISSTAKTQQNDGKIIEKERGPGDLLSKVGEEELEVVGVVALHQSDKGAAWVEGPLEDGLQQAVGGDLYGDGIRWDVLQGLLEEDGADQVVDVVLG